MIVSEHSCFAMGTRFHVILPGTDRFKAMLLGKEIDRILQWAENLMSRYKPDSPVSRLNKDGYRTPQVLNDDLKEILNLCREYNTKTGGAFDPVQPVIKPTENHDSDSQHSFHQIGKRGWKNLAFEKDKASFLSLGWMLDLGGFGKGWATERIISLLKTNGIENALISFGDSTISAIGKNPLGESWLIDIPTIHEGRPLALHLVDESISISGLKAKRVNGELVKTPHIVRPADGKMVTDDSLILVRSESALKAEILSTALTAADHTQKTIILHNFANDQVFLCTNTSWQKITSVENEP